MFQIHIPTRKLAVRQSLSSVLFRSTVREHRAGSMSRRDKTIVVIGERAVGKTSIVHRLLEEPVDFTTYKPTIDDCYNITWKLPGELGGCMCSS